MNKQELTEILEYIKPDAENLCIQCASPVSTSTRYWSEPRPYGATVAYEDLAEDFNFCRTCREEDTNSNLAQDLLDKLRGNTAVISTGHLLYLATVIAESMGSEVNVQEAKV